MIIKGSFKDSAKSVSICPTADVEALTKCLSWYSDSEAIPVSGEPRPCRDRIATPFLKAKEIILYYIIL